MPRDDTEQDVPVLMVQPPDGGRWEDMNLADVVENYVKARVEEARARPLHPCCTVLPLDGAPHGQDFCSSHPLLSAPPLSYTTTTTLAHTWLSRAGAGGSGEPGLVDWAAQGLEGMGIAHRTVGGRSPGRR